MTQQWISVKEQLPEAKQQVLAVILTGYQNTQYTTMVVFIPEMTVKAEDFWSDDSDCTEYNEEEDCYYVEAGWYEDSFESETQWKLSCEVTHWMPLPAKPEVLGQ